MNKINMYQLPETCIKRDGFEVPFELYKIKFLINDLSLSENENEILESFSKELSGQNKVSTDQIEKSFLNV